MSQHDWSMVDFDLGQRSLLNQNLLSLKCHYYRLIGLNLLCHGEEYHYCDNDQARVVIGVCSI